jgi:hypothetical protein
MWQFKDSIAAVHKQLFLPDIGLPKFPIISAFEIKAVCRTWKMMIVDEKK